MEGLSNLTNQFLQPREHIRATPRSSPIAEGLANFGGGGLENIFKALQELYGSKSGSNPTVGFNNPFRGAKGGANIGSSLG